MKIHSFLFKPKEIIRIFWHLMSGLKIFKYNLITLLKHTPDCVNSMSTAFNLLRSDFYTIPKTIIDIGANNSQMIKLLTFNNFSEIISLEPNRDTHPIGKLYPYALSNFIGKSYFHVPKGDTLWGKITDEKVEDGFEIDVLTFEKFATDIIDFSKIQKPVLVKIDTEGHELKVLEGFGKYFDKIGSILIEVSNDNNIFKVSKLLNDVGFKNSKIIYAAKSANGIPFYFDIYFWKSQNN